MNRHIRKWHKKGKHKDGEGGYVIPPRLKKEIDLIKKAWEKKG